VRQWRCKDCGSLHDRDTNSAIHTLYVGIGAIHERDGDKSARTEIPSYISDRKLKKCFVICVNNLVEA